MILGAGIGWLQEEFQALGIPFAGRGQRTEESIAAMRALWSQERASFHGVTASFTDCFLRPQPSGGTIPIHLGGHSEAAARRAGRIADGFFPMGLSHEGLPPLLDLLHKSAEEAGRDPATIEVTVPCYTTNGKEALVQVAALQKLGATRILVPATLFGADFEPSLSRYGEEVIG
jgi:alkanesulfonate monooxygenase SsuD/methylene tetrahydromethanopterin reductase-like flavin-dependent oxidoreductase (luciferase family)